MADISISLTIGRCKSPNPHFPKDQITTDAVEAIRATNVLEKNVWVRKEDLDEVTIECDVPVNPENMFRSKLEQELAIRDLELKDYLLV